MPFVFAKAVVIFGVNYCEFALGQRDFSGGKAVAETAVQEQQEYYRFVKPMSDIESVYNNC